MEIKQVYELVNNATAEILGEQSVLQEDMQNVVDIGTELFNANSVDKYVRKLVDHIGKVIFVNRPYAGGVPSVLMDGWEYGAVLQKVQAELPEATENESWQLENGVSYDPNIFYKPEVSDKFYNKRTTFEIPMSFTELQIKGSFSNAEQMNAFLSMLYTSVENAMTVRTDSLIMRTINNMIGETMYNMNSGGTYTGAGNTRAYNLLKMYNDTYGKSLTEAACRFDADFIRYAAYMMSLVESRMTKISSLFNIGGKDRFTPSDRMHVVLLSEFAKAADVFLQSGTWHDEFTKLPKAETVPYWQGSGTDYAFTSNSAINITTASGHNVSLDGILGVMFDRDSLGVCNLDRRVTTNYNPKAEFYNNWYKFDCGYFNDTNENFVVFYVAA